jgi:hypothetical protein
VWLAAGCVQQLQQAICSNAALLVAVLLAAKLLLLLLLPSTAGLPSCGW